MADGRHCLARGKPHSLSLLGSANLIHPGLRPNGSSNTASRHRLGKGRVPARRGLGR
jgi:hypothetical protein